MAKLMMEVPCGEKTCRECPRRIEGNVSDEAECSVFLDCGYPASLSPGPPDEQDGDFYRCDACLAAEEWAKEKP